MESLLKAIIEIGLKINVDKIMAIGVVFMSYNQNTGQNHNIRI
jgi:hypothetical protein